jgi:enoyl-CoA hydratase/carnithine racemase
VSGERVIVAVDGAVARITLNRPERRNALDAAAWEELAGAIEGLRDRGGLGCVVLTGAGDAFAAGGDLGTMLAELRSPDGARRFRDRIARCLDGLAELPMPTIAAVNGPAIGGGLELAVACDVRIAAASASFAMPAARFGMVMAAEDFARLAAVVGVDRARYLAISAEQVDAAEAHRIGLVHLLTDDGELEDAVGRMARRLCRMVPEAVAWFRRAATGLTPALADPELERFEAECLTSEPFHERVEGYLAR